MKLTRRNLGTEFRIWVPCEAGTDAVDDLINEMVAIAGGMTVTSGVGVWVKADGEGMQEDVHVLSFITTDDLTMNTKIEELAKTLLEEGQEAVLVSYDDHRFLLTPDIEEANPHIKFSWRN